MAVHQPFSRARARAFRVACETDFVRPSIAYPDFSWAHNSTECHVREDGWFRRYLAIGTPLARLIAYLQLGDALPEAM
jgi:hypothetical protein